MGVADRLINVYIYILTVCLCFVYIYVCTYIQVFASKLHILYVIKNHLHPHCIKSVSIDCIHYSVFVLCFKAFTGLIVFVWSNCDVLKNNNTITFIMEQFKTKQNQFSYLKNAKNHSKSVLRHCFFSV